MQIFFLASNSLSQIPSNTCSKHAINTNVQLGDTDLLHVLVDEEMIHVIIAQNIIYNQILT